VTGNSDRVKEYGGEEEVKNEEEEEIVREGEWREREGE
jgi:hypothetical protein